MRAFRDAVHRMNETVQKRKRVDHAKRRREKQF